MVDLTAKVFLFPALLFLASRIVSGLGFMNIYHILLTGLVLAVLAASADHLFLNKIKNPLSTLLDGGLTVLTLLAANWVWSGTTVTLVGALLFAALLGVVEYLTHELLLKNHMW